MHNGNDKQHLKTCVAACANCKHPRSSHGNHDEACFLVKRQGGVILHCTCTEWRHPRHFTGAKKM